MYISLLLKKIIFNKLCFLLFQLHLKTTVSLIKSWEQPQLATITLMSILLEGRIFRVSSIEAFGPLSPSIEAVTHFMTSLITKEIFRHCDFDSKGLTPTNGKSYWFLYKTARIMTSIFGYFISRVYCWGKGRHEAHRNVTADRVPLTVCKFVRKIL